MNELKAIIRMELDGIAPYNFENTIRKYTLYGIEWYWLTPFEVFLKGTLWTAIRLNNNTPIGLRLRSIGNVENPKVSVSVFSKVRLSNDEENEAVDTLTWILGLKENILDFYILADNYKPLKQAKEDLFGMRIAKNPNLFDRTLLAITLQMASYGRTEQMIRLIYENYGEQLKFDGKKVIISPTAEKISNVNESELRLKCKVGYRAKSIITNAKLIAAGEIPSVTKLRSMPIEDARSSLGKMVGIGEYSKDVILFDIQPCFPIDVWSVNYFCKLFGIEIKDKPRKMIPDLKEFAKKEFGKWQSYVYDYIINDLEKLLTD
jgi:3-methyladenine DNA glycosylase/8-oxoguanine DNA glycosylase